MTGHVDRVSRLARAEVNAVLVEETTAAYAELLEAVRDVGFHFGDGSGGFLDSGSPEADARLAAGLVERLRVAAARGGGRVEDAFTRWAWQSCGAPLRCGSCGEAIEPAVEGWRVCDGWAEHAECHTGNGVEERLRRADQLAEDEWEAHLEQRRRHGPAEGDLVVLNVGGPNVVDGVWTVAAGRAGVLARDGQFHQAGPHAAIVEVVGLAGDW